MGKYQDQLEEQQKNQEYARKFEARILRQTKAQMESKTGNPFAGMQDSPNSYMATLAKVDAGRTKAEEKMAKLQERGDIKKQKLGGQEFMVGPKSAFAPFNNQDGDNLGSMRLGNNFDAPETTHGDRGIKSNRKTKQQLDYINALRAERGESPVGMDQLDAEGQKASAYKSMLEGKGQEGNIDPNVAMRIVGYDDNGRPLIQQVNPVTGEDIGQSLENNRELNTRFDKTEAGKASVDQQIEDILNKRDNSFAGQVDSDGTEGVLGNIVNTGAQGLAIGADVATKIAQGTQTLKNIGIDAFYGGASEKDKQIFNTMEAKKEEAAGLSKVLQGMDPKSSAYSAVSKRLTELNTLTPEESELINRSTSKETAAAKKATKEENKLRSEAAYARESLTEEQYKNTKYAKVLPYKDDIRPIKTAKDWKAALSNGTFDALTNTYNASAKPYKQTTFNAYENLRAKKVIDKPMDSYLGSVKQRSEEIVDSAEYNAGMGSYNEHVAKGEYFKAVKDVINPKVLTPLLMGSAGEMATLTLGGIGGAFAMADDKLRTAEETFKKVNGREMNEDEKAKAMALSVTGVLIAKGGIESVVGKVNFAQIAGKGFDKVFNKLPKNTQEIIGKYSTKFGMSKQEATKEIFKAAEYAKANKLVKAPRGAYSTKVGNTTITTPKSTSQVKATGDIAPGKKLSDSLKPQSKTKPADVTATANKNVQASVDDKIAQAAKTNDKTKIRKALDLSWKGAKGTVKGLGRGAKAIGSTKAVTAMTGEALSEGGEFITDTYAATGGSADTKINGNQLKSSMILGSVLGGVMHGVHAPIQAHRTAKINKKIGKAKDNLKSYFKYANQESPDYNPLKAAEMLASENMPAYFAAAEGGDAQKGMANWHQAAATAKQGIMTAMAQKMASLAENGATTEEILSVHGVYQDSVNKLETYKESLVASDIAAIKDSISTKKLDKGTVDHLADTVAVYGADYFTDEELQRTLSNPAINDSQKAMLRAAIAFNGARASFVAENQEEPIKIHHAGNDGVAVAPDGTLTVGGALDQFKESNFKDTTPFDEALSRLRNEGGSETEIRMWEKAKEMAVLSGSYADTRSQEIAQSEAANTSSDGTKAPDVPTANAANVKMRTAMQVHKVGKVPGSKGESVVTRKQGKRQKFFLNSDTEAQAKLYENKKWKNNPELKDVEFESFDEYIDYRAREVVAMNAEAMSGKSLKEIQDNNVSRTKQILNSMGKASQSTGANGSDAVAQAVDKSAKFDHIPNKTNKAGDFKVDTASAGNPGKRRNLEKDKAKFNNEKAPINKLIAFGLPGTSTATHARANAAMIEENDFSPDDIVGISINGISRKTGKPEEVVAAYDANTKRTMKALRKAIEAKATIVADNLSDRTRNFNNKTEGTIAKILAHQGYVEIDHSGVWVHEDHIKSVAESTDNTVDARTEAKGAWEKVKDALKGIKVKRKKNTMSTRETRGLTLSPTPNTTYKAKDIHLPDIPQLANKSVNAVRYDYLMEMLHRIRKMEGTSPALKRIIKALEYQKGLSASTRMSLFSQAVNLAGIGSINTTTKTISRINKQRLDLIAKISGLNVNTKTMPKDMQRVIKQIKKQKYAVAFTNDVLAIMYDSMKLYPLNNTVAEGSKLAYEQLLENTIDVASLNKVPESDARYVMSKLLKSAKKLLKQKSYEAKSIIGMEANLPSKWAQPMHRKSLIFQYNMTPHQVSLMDVLMAEYETFAKNYEATSGAADATNYKYMSNYLQDMSMLLANKDTRATPENVMFAGQLAFREYVLRNAQSLTMPTESDAKAFFGRKNEDTIRGEALALIQNAGLPINIVAPNIGRGIIKHLNLVFDSSVDASFQKNLEHSLGMHVLTAMRESKILDINEIATKDISRYHALPAKSSGHATNNHVTFVKLKHNIEKRRGVDTIVQGDYANNNSALFQQYKSALSLFDISKPRNHSHKPIKATSKYVEGSVMHVDSLHQRVQESLQSVKFVANDIAFQLATKLGIDAMMDVQGYNNDLDPLHVTKRPGAIGKNRSIENEVREAFMFLDEEMRDDNGKLDPRKGFYLQTKIISSTRIQEVSNTIKIQGSSLHRQLYGAEAWDTDVHMDDVQVMQAVSEILEEQIGMTLDEAMEDQDIQDITDITEKEELTDADKAILVEFANKHEKFASLQALHIVSNYRKALKNRRKKFRVFMPHETDGVSNGVISAKLQLPPSMGVMDKEYTEFMARGGVFVNNAYTTVGDFLNTLDGHGNKHVDNYMNIMRHTANIIDEAKKTTLLNNGVGVPKSKDQRRIASQAQWDFTDIVVAPIIENGQITREARKVGKLPLMTTVYGAGKTAVFEAQYATLMENLYADLAKEDSKYLGAVTKLLGTSHSFLGKNGKPLSVKQRREKQFTEDELVVIKDALEATHGDALGAAIDIVLFDFMESRNVMNAMGKFVNTVFVSQFKEAYTARATELGKVNLTQNDVNELLKEFRNAGKLPSYLLSLSDSDISGVMISGETNVTIPENEGGKVQAKFGKPIPKTRISMVNGKIVTSPARATKSLSGALTKREYGFDTGVKPFQVLNISVDSAVNTLTALGENVANVHDATLQSVLETAALGGKGNLAYLTVHRDWSMVESMDRAVQKAYTTYSNLPQEQRYEIVNTLADDRVTAYGNQLPVLEYDGETAIEPIDMMTVWATFTEAKKAARAEFFNEITGVGQFDTLYGTLRNSEDEQEVPPEVKTYAKDLKDDLEKVATGDGSIPDYKTRLGLVPSMTPEQSATVLAHNLVDAENGTDSEKSTANTEYDIAPIPENFKDSPFKAVTADVLNAPTDNAVVITTNGNVTAKGKLTMGKGLALQAKRRFPGIDQKLGGIVKENGNVPHMVQMEEKIDTVIDLGSEANSQRTVISLPTKPSKFVFDGSNAMDTYAGKMKVGNSYVGWKAKTELNTLRANLNHLVKLADKEGLQKIALTLPGYGEGGLKLKEIKPLLDEILDDRFTLYLLPYAIDEDVEPTTLDENSAPTTPESTTHQATYDYKNTPESERYLVVNNKFEANPDQKKLIDKLTEFLMTDGVNKFILQGRGGTGKTSSLARGLMNYASENNGQPPRDVIHLSTISHQAKNVLMDASDELNDTNGLSPKVSVLASLLYNPESKPNAPPKGNFKNLIGTAKDTIVVVDEISMVDEATLAKLNRYIAMGGKVIFMGDYHQIMAVVKGGPTKLSTVFEEFNNVEAVGGRDGSTYTYELRQIMRQKEGSGILDLANYFADSIDVKLKKILPENASKLSDAFEKAKASTDTAVIDEATAVRKYAKLVKEGNNDLLYTTGKNRDVHRINRAIRQELYGDSDVEYQIGEHLIAYGNQNEEWANSKGKPRITNSSRYVLSDIEHFTVIPDTAEETLGLGEVPVDTGVMVPKWKPGTRLVRLTLKGKGVTKDNSIVIPVGLIADSVSNFLNNKQDNKIAEAYLKNAVSKHVEMYYRPHDSSTNVKYNNGVINLAQKKTEGMYTSKLVNQMFPSLQATIMYGYASTVHKAQGSGFHTSFTTLEKSKKMPGDTRAPSANNNHINYTAVTRAKRNLYIVTDNATLLSQVGQPDKELLGSTSDDFDINELNQIADVEVTPATISETFENLTTLGGKKDSTAHEQRLRELLNSIVSPFLNTYSMVQKIKQVKKGMATGASAVGISRATIYAKVTTTSKPGLTSGMSNAEVYTHELMHPIIRKGFENNPDLRNEARRMLDTIRRRYDENKLIDMLMPETYTGTEAEERANVKARYEYLFNNDRTGLEEFVVHGLTNEALLKALGKEKFNTELGKKPEGFWDKLSDLFSRLISRLSGHGAPRNRPTTMDKALTEIAYAAVYSQQSAIAGVKTNKSNFLNRYNNMAVKAFRNWVSHPVQRNLQRGYRNVPAGRTNPITGRSKYVVPLAILAQKDTTYWNNKIASKSIGKMIDHIGVSREFFGRQIIAEITGMDHIAKSWRGMLRRFKHSLDGAAMDIADGYAADMKKAFSKDTTDAEWNSLTHMLRTDPNALLNARMRRSTMEKMYGSDTAHRQREIGKIINKLKQSDPDGHNYLVAQAKSLGNFLATGDYLYHWGMPNATAIATFHALDPVDVSKLTANQKGSLKNRIKHVDALATLVAIDTMPSSHRVAIHRVMKRENARKRGNGISALLDAQQLFIKESKEKLFSNDPKKNTGELLMTKGYIKEKYSANKAIKIGDLSVETKQKMAEQGFFPVLNNAGEAMPLDTAGHNINDSYIYATKINGMARYLSGTMSITNEVAKGTLLEDRYIETDGTDVETLMNNRRAANNTERGYLAKLIDGTATLTAAEKYVVPILREEHQVGKFTPAYQYRFMMNHKTREQLLLEENPAYNVIGGMFGSIITKVAAKNNNKDAIMQLYKDFGDMYESNPKAFAKIHINSSNPRYKEYWKMLPDDTKRAARQLWKQDVIYVHKSLIPLVLGYRKKEFTEWLDDGLRTVSNGVITLSKVKMGGDEKNMKQLMKHSGILWEGIVKRFKSNVVVKMPTTFGANYLSNIVVSWMNGMSLPYTIQKQAEGLKNLIQYQEDKARMQRLERYLARQPNHPNKAKIKRDIAKYKNALETNGFHVLIKEGMVSTIMDDVEVTDNPLLKSIKVVAPKFHQRVIEDGSKNIPKGIREAYNIALMNDGTKVADLAYKATQYSDAVARYAEYYYFREEDGQSHEDALNNIAEDFITYDDNTNPFLQWTNDIGLFMFTKFFLRSQRVIWKQLKNKPVNVLAYKMLDNMVGIPDIFDSNMLGYDLTNRINGPGDILEDAFSINILKYLDVIIPD